MERSHGADVVDGWSWNIPEASSHSNGNGPGLVLCHSWPAAVAGVSAVGAKRRWKPKLDDPGRMLLHAGRHFFAERHSVPIFPQRLARAGYHGQCVSLFRRLSLCHRIAKR